MNYIKPFLLVLLISSGISFQTGTAQQITARFSNQPSAGNAFLINGNTLQFQQNSAVINGQNVRNVEAFTMNGQRTLISFVLRNSDSHQLGLYSTNGEMINSVSELELSGDDPSVMSYPLINGRIVVRQNIANFTIYDTYGNISETVSNSSGSKKGESISKLAMDSGGSNIILYNPRINYNNSTGSRAQRLGSDGYLDNLFSSRERTIHKLHITESGSFILVLTKSPGTDDQVVLLDRFGNNLGEFEFEEELLDARFGLQENHLVAYSSGRIRVFNLFSGESLGSTSIRGTGTIFYADYSPQDNQILALTGVKSKNTDYINSVEAHAVHIGKRELDDTGVVNSYLTHPQIPLKMERTAANRYTVTGGSGDITISTEF